MKLQQQVIWITGASSGVGEGMARVFHREGAHLILSARREAELQRVKASCQGPGTIDILPFDICDATAREAAARSVLSRHPRLDVLVNNAGIEGENVPTDRLSLAEWNRVMAVDATAVFLCTKHVIPYLRQAGGGSVINISSIYGIVGGGDIPPYHAAKGAVRCMSKNDALTYASERIRVNSIHPGFIFTALVDRYVHDAGLERSAAKASLDALHPLGGTGTPDDIAWGAVYLASDEARWVTGAELVIDGGYTAR